MPRSTRGVMDDAGDGSDVPDDERSDFANAANDFAVGDHVSVLDYENLIVTKITAVRTRMRPPPVRAVCAVTACTDCVRRR